MELCFNHPVVCCSLSLSLSLTTPTFPLSPCCLYIGMSLVRRRRRQPAIYSSEQVCIGWHRTGACYTDKLTFSHSSSIKVWGAYYRNVRIIFKFLRYKSLHTAVMICATLVKTHALEPCMGRKFMARPGPLGFGPGRPVFNLKFSGPAR